jgi:hypothetical protein
MLVYYFGHVEGTLAEVALLISDSQSDLSAWAELAVRHGEELTTRINPGPFMPAKEVHIEVGRADRRSGSVVIPIKWQATGAEALFPEMDADLVLQPIGGSYDPPFGGIGRLLDRALLHRLAEASVKSFVDQLCIAVNERSNGSA